MTRDNLIRLVQLSFWAVVVFSEGTARHGFLQGVMVQKQALFASMMQNKVGTLIILAILVAFVWLARTAV